MHVSGAALAPHVRIVLKKHPDWLLAIRTRCHCGTELCSQSMKRMDRAKSLLTKRALELFFTNARVTVRQKRLRGQMWLFARIAYPGRSAENAVMRQDARELLTKLGVRYDSYDARVGRRLYIRLAVNDGPFRRL